MKLLAALALAVASLSSAAAEIESDDKHARVVPGVLPAESIAALHGQAGTARLLRKTSFGDKRNRKHGGAIVQPEVVRRLLDPTLEPSESPTLSLTEEPTLSPSQSPPTLSPTLSPPNTLADPLDPDDYTDFVPHRISYTLPHRVAAPTLSPTETPSCLPGTCLQRYPSDGFPYDTVVHDGRIPYTDRDERIVTGSISLALLQDDTEVTCPSARELEELVLNYLADNIGGLTFEPVCVEVVDNAYCKRKLVGDASSGKAGKWSKSTWSSSSSSSGGSSWWSRSRKPGKRQGKRRKANKRPKANKRAKGRECRGRRFVESNVVELRVSYVIYKRPERKLEDEERSRDEDDLDTAPSYVHSDGEDRGLQQAQCSPLDRAQCCSQNAINGDIGQYCLSLGCNVQRCGRGRRPRRQSFVPRRLEGRVSPQNETMPHDAMPLALADAAHRRLDVPPFTLRGVDFTAAVRRYTMFEPNDSEAHLDVEDIDSLACCSANRYSIEECGTPVLECKDFKSEGCDGANDDMLPPLEPEEGSCLVDGSGSKAGKGSKGSTWS
ncbi:hypothetical protein ACHAXT_013180, partial [Thalassiosira profunda]